MNKNTFTQSIEIFSLNGNKYCHTKHKKYSHTNINTNTNANANANTNIWTNTKDINITREYVWLCSAGFQVRPQAPSVKISIYKSPAQLHKSNRIGLVYNAKTHDWPVYTGREGIVIFFFNKGPVGYSIW